MCDERSLMEFVPPNFLPVPVLVIDAAEILPDLRKILPAAQIALLTTEPTPAQKKICAEIHADIFVGDWTSLPPAPKVFELIVAPKIFSANDVYAALLTLNSLLTDSGALLALFNESWTKRDVVKILDDAIYKEIIFSGKLVRAGKCTAEVAALKDFFTPEVRAQLSRLLHRIEYDIDAEENFQRLADLCDREGIFAEYLTDFVEQVVVHAAAKKSIVTRLT